MPTAAIKKVSIRITADTCDEATAAIDALIAAIGTARIEFCKPRPGRGVRQGQKRKPVAFSYGTFRFEVDLPDPPAATGATQRLTPAPAPRSTGRRWPHVQRWTRARVDSWLDTFYPGLYVTVEKGGVKGFAQRGSKTARLLSTELCGSTWRDVARKLGAL